MNILNSRFFLFFTINVVFIISSLDLVAQNRDYFEINFIKYDNYVKRIYINNRLITSFGESEIVKCKMYSKGRFAITIVQGSSMWEGIVNVAENDNKDYYFIVGYEKHNGVKYNHEEIPLETYNYLKRRFEEKKNKNYDVISIEEDVNNPIGELNVSSAQSQKQGTGFLINDEGYIITSFHVIDGAEEIIAKGIKGDYSLPIQLDIVSIDRQLDLALLKVKTELVSFETPPYFIRSSKGLSQASDIFVLGYPMKSTMGNEIKVTSGIVNSISGYKGSISEFQISASVQPGNSGGPLLDKYGNIVGVVSAKIKSEEIDNVGYAIKSDYLTFFLEQVGDIKFKQEDIKSDNTETNLSTQVKEASNYVYIIEAK